MRLSGRDGNGSQARHPASPPWIAKSSLRDRSLCAAWLAYTLGRACFAPAECAPRQHETAQAGICRFILPTRSRGILFGGSSRGGP